MIKFILFNKQAIYQKYKPNSNFHFIKIFSNLKTIYEPHKQNRISEQHKKIQHELNQPNQCQNSSQSWREIKSNLLQNRYFAWNWQDWLPTEN